MIANLSHVMTLANGIIGVSILAMPFCFKQCGIILATLVLLVSSIVSRLACHFLIKSAVMSRRRNFEFLAFHAFGRTGKFLVELFIIGFLVGTCIAFFVVVGDLGPQIVGKMLDKKPEDIRTSLLVTTGTFIVFPLGLLRNIDSLSSVCTATIGFYLCLVVKVIAESSRHIFLGDWYDRVMYWRPAGILQCLPIFAMALFCQTQLFEIYQAIPNVSLEKMNQVTKGALDICTIAYLCVGFFGYVAFCTQPFTGNILMSFEPSLTSDIIKMGFVFSVAFSFPLVIFPCRASLNSLLFRRAIHTHEPSNYYIPEMRFRCLTLTIVAMSLGTGILIPNIEFVLGIVGSTIGVMICLIFPAAFFIAISTKNTNERLIAQAILFFGMWIMILGTYANLYAMEESSSARLFITTGKPLHRINDIITSNGIPRERFPLIQQLPKDVKIIPEQSKENVEMSQQQLHKDLKENDEPIDVRREPPIPVERSIMTEKSPVEIQNLEKNLVGASLSPLMENKVEEMKNHDTNIKKNSGQAVVPAVEPKSKDIESNIIAAVEKADRKEGQTDEQRNENLIDSDAIKKEESELAAAGDLANIESAARLEKLHEKLEKHKLQQLEMMEEQKELLKDIKEQKQEMKMEKKRLAEEQRKQNSDTRDEKVNKAERNKEEKSFILPNNPVDGVTQRFVEGQDEKKNTQMKRNFSINETNVQQSVLNNQERTNSNNSLPKNEASKDVDKTVVSSIVESDKSRGPILNALTNWTSKRNASGMPLLTNEGPRDDLKVAHESNVDKVVEPLPNKSPLEFALPIALQMRNQTKVSVDPKTKNAVSVNPDSMAIHREILERSDRGKREAIENLTRANEIDIASTIQDVLPTERDKNIESERKSNDRNIINDQCRPTDDKSLNFISRDETSAKTNLETSISTSTIITKSIVDLTEQRLTDKMLSLNSSNVYGDDQADLSKLKNRDLKALSQEE